MDDASNDITETCDSLADDIRRETERETLRRLRAELDEARAEVERLREYEKSCLDAEYLAQECDGISPDDWSPAILIDHLRTCAEKAEVEIIQLKEGLGFNRPYNVLSVLEVLADAAEHLLTTHSCDAHGHERTKAAMESAREMLRALLDESELGHIDGGVDHHSCKSCDIVNVPLADGRCLPCHHAVLMVQAEKAAADNARLREGIEENSVCDELHGGPLYECGKCQGCNLRALLDESEGPGG